jgi:hypothetical protein
VGGFTWTWICSLVVPEKSVAQRVAKSLLEHWKPAKGLKTSPESQFRRAKENSVINPSPFRRIITQFIDKVSQLYHDSPVPAGISPTSSKSNKLKAPRVPGGATA